MSRFGKDAVALQSDWQQQVTFSALYRIIPPRTITRVLQQTRRSKRFCSRAPDAFMVFFVIAMGLYRGDCYRQVCRALTSKFRKKAIPGRSTLCEARHRLGVAPLVVLAAQIIRLLARPDTPGAFYNGMRLMAADGFVVDLPDTPANDRAFGRPRNNKSPGPFPQAQVLGLVECGTHVFWRCQIKPCNVGETVMLGPLLKHLEPGMLLLWDRGFASYDLVRKVRGRKAHLLARWKTNRILVPIGHLKDGSYLSRLYANDSDRRAHRNGVDVRIIEYTIKDDNARQPDRHRLLTTLLDEKAYPIKELVELYHCRWEEEISIGELKTHQMENLAVRSGTPAGVVQELYGLLLGHFVVRSVMFEASEKAGVAPQRISFTGTLKILRCRLPQCPRQSKARLKWYKELLEEITEAEELLPVRRRRINPRVIKRKQSAWPKKRPKHRNPPQPTGAFIDLVVFLR